MNIIKKIYRKYKGKRAVRILKKSDVLPLESKKLYRDIKRANIK